LFLNRILAIAFGKRSANAVDLRVEEVL
jgi:hypothetical protein